jgi:hypothetical protein
MRLTVNYDIVLLSLLAHNYEKAAPNFEREHCILHPIGKKVPVAVSGEIFDRIIDINTILGYHKIVDDVIDEDKHRTIKAFLKGKYKKAAKRMPQFNAAVSAQYAKLRELEEYGCLDIEKLASCFGEIMVAAAAAATPKADDKLKDLCYNLGKWIYYIDAFDDIKEDYENNKFNPFIIKGRKVDENFYAECEKNARYLLYSAIDRIIENYDKMDITISEGALSNIIYLGLKARAEEVLKRRGNKCKKIRL